MHKKNPVAIVSNATEYAGPGSVNMLAAEGFQMVCDDRKFAGAAIRDDYEAQHPGCVATAAASPEQLVREAIERFGQIDAVISNDFATIDGGAVDELGAPAFRAAFEALTVTPFRLCAAAAREMKRQRHGQIVLVTSGAGRTNPVSSFAPGDVRTGYIVAREAANALARCMALELAPFGIQVNAVAPYLLYSQTFFPSPLGAADPQFRDLLNARIPMGRWGRDEEIGALVALLASGRAAFISGQVIPFSGAGA